VSPRACRTSWVGLAVVSLLGFVAAEAGSQPVSASGGPYVASRDYRVDGYRPKTVPAEALPGYQSYGKLEDATRPVNARGIALWLNNGHKLYNPLVIARYGADLVNSYRLTHAPEYLDRAETNANFLVNTGVLRSGGLYFPYRFGFGLFGNHRDLMRAPWYSALAQGAALTLFVRLHAVTGEQRWRTAADSTFATFTQRRSPKWPWIAFVPHKYLWFELAPKNPPLQALDAHMAALFSVYEYALATGSPAAAKVFDGGATAVRHQVHRFRVRGGISYVSIRVHARERGTHCFHIADLKLLARITGASWFAREARLFAADAPRACSSQRAGSPLRRAVLRPRPPSHPRSGSR
jgi:D-glucuronyl C5-epimerase C-terminus